MPRALKLTEKTVLLCAIQSEQPTADIQAMYDHYRNSGLESYIVLDWESEGGYAPWLAMSKELFDKQFRFAFGENPNKFEPVYRF